VKLTGPAAALKGSKIKVTCTVSGVLEDSYSGSTGPTLKWEIGSKAADGVWDQGTKYSAKKEVRLEVGKSSTRA
jgi:hypothetical protein